MIAIITPNYGMRNEFTYITRQVEGIKELCPIILNLGRTVGNFPYPVHSLRSESLLLNLISRIYERGYKFWHFQMMGNEAHWEERSFGIQPILMKFLSDLPIKLVLVHFASVGTSCISVLEKIKVPVVVVCHASEIYSYQRSSGYLRRLRSLFQRADAVICVSKYILKKTIEFGCPPSKAKLLYLGTIVPTRNNYSRPANERLIIASTGRLVPVKGFDILIRAWEILYREDGLEAELRIIGDGPIRYELERQAMATGLGNSIRFLGARTNDQVYDILSSADIYVQASRNEGLPIAILEAMAVSLPVVATDVGGVSEIVLHRKTGILVSPENPDTLADGIFELVRDEAARKELGQNARIMVESDFDHQKENAKLVALLEALIRDSAR